MVEVKSLRKYIEKDISIKLIAKIYAVLKDCSADYNNFDAWFFDNQLKKVEHDEGDILFVVKGGDIVGISCISESPIKEITTLYVVPEYRLKKIGESLLNSSLEYLKTNKPVFNCPLDKISMFEPFIKKYSWKK